jgi:ABC-type dipeptide/oligopeptide/nickel transport system permease component
VTPAPDRRRLRLAVTLAVTLPAGAVLWGALQPGAFAAGVDLAVKLACAAALAFGFFGLGRLGWLPDFLARRLVSLVIVLVGASTLVFGALRVAPGDPVDSILGEQASAEARAALTEALCLDAPLLTQYDDCFWDTVLDGSLGRTFDVSPQPVIDLVAENFPATAELALAGMIVALCIALPLGLLAALRQATWVDHTATGFAMLGVAVPAFWLGPMLILAFTVHLDWLPSPARTDQPLAALVLPALTLGTSLSAKLTRMVRSSLLEVMSDEYVVTARAKGLPEPIILVKHVLRNALIPVVTVMGIQFGALLTGAIVTEKVFARPGVGTLLLDAIQTRDYPTVQGTVLLIATTYVTVNLLTDVLYAVIDPRVRLDA